MSKCACKDENCQIEIGFDSASSTLLFTDKNGEQTVMYLDANTIVKLVSELRQVLNYMVSHGE